MREDSGGRGERRPRPARTAINQHLYRHHGRLSVTGTTVQRLEAHDELHFQAKRKGIDLGHVHLPYQDGESEEGMAQRYLREGEEGAQAQQPGATAPVPPQE